MLHNPDDAKKLIKRAINVYLQRISSLDDPIDRIAEILALLVAEAHASTVFSSTALQLLETIDQRQCYFLSLPSFKVEQGTGLTRFIEEERRPPAAWSTMK